MCNPPFFSIVITIYNGESTIEDTIKSIFNQTFKNFELLIYNDGSIDNTDLIINELLEKYSFRYESLPKTGRVALLNLAIRNAKADYICICDCDDIWHPRKLQFQYSFLERNPKAVFVCTKMDFFYEGINFQTYVDFAVKIIPNYLFYLYNPISHSSIAFKKGIFLYADISQHDYNLYFDFIGGNAKIYQINKVLTFNRIHSNQNFQSGGKKYYLESLKLLKTNILSSRKYHFFVFYVIKIIYYFLFSSIRRRILIKSTLD